MIEIKQGDSKFYVGESEENPIAEIIYIEEEKNKLTIESTRVSEKLQGQGVAKQLVEKVVEFARHEDKKVSSKCPYAQAQFQKNSDYHDVWDR